MEMVRDGCLDLVCTAKSGFLGLCTLKDGDELQSTVVYSSCAVVLSMGWILERLHLPAFAPEDPTRAQTPR